MEVGDHLAEVFALDVVVEMAGVSGVGEALVLGIGDDLLADEVREAFVFVRPVDEREYGPFAGFVFRMGETRLREGEVQIFLPKPRTIEEDSVDAVG